jgi:hypothetical protein
MAESFCWINLSAAALGISNSLFCDEEMKGIVKRHPKYYP